MSGHREEEGAHTCYLGLLYLLEEVVDLCIFWVSFDGGALFFVLVCSLRHESVQVRRAGRRME